MEVLFLLMGIAFVSVLSSFLREEKNTVRKKTCVDSGVVTTTTAHVREFEERSLKVSDVVGAAFVTLIAWPFALLSMFARDEAPRIEVETVTTDGKNTVRAKQVVPLNGNERIADQIKKS